MTNPNTWTPNAMEVGVANCNPDLVNANLEYLKYAADNVAVSIPFALNSGNVDANGNADLLAYSGTTLSFKVDNNVSYKPLAITYADKSQEVLTSLANITGLSTDGTYKIIKEKGQNPVALSIPVQGKDLFVDFSQGNANDNYGLHTATLFGSPTFTGNKFNSNGTTGVWYPIQTFGTTSWCITQKFKSTNTTTEQSLWSTGNSYATRLKKDASNKLVFFASGNNTTYNIANSALGTKTDWSTTVEYWTRTYFTGTQYKVDWSTDSTNGVDGTWTNDITVASTTLVYSAIGSINFGIDGLSGTIPLIGTMDNLQVTIGQAICQLKNQITEGKTFPIYPIDGDLHCLTATGLQTYKRVSGAWAETQYAQIGTATVSGGVITAVTTNAYNQNGYDVNIYSTAKKYDSGWFAVAVGTTYTKTHGLGTSNITYQVLFSPTADGANSNPIYGAHNDSIGGSAWCGFYQKICSSTTISFTTASNYVGYDSTTEVASGYYRVLAEVI